MTIVVGASRDDDNEKGVDSGSAYVFEKVGNAWEQKAKLTASDGDVNGYFGISLAISEEKIVVGVLGLGLGASVGSLGSVYVFESPSSAHI
jgi:hypothetical protein